MASTDLQCTRCPEGSLIEAGTRYVRDMTGAPQHPECARRGMSRHVEREAPRSWASPIPRPEATDVVVACPECGYTVTAEDWPTSVTVFGKRFHRECRLRGQGGAAR